MAISEAQRRANAKHDKENFEYCTVKTRKGKRAAWKAHAAAKGESLNGFLNRAIDETVERDGGNPTNSESDIVTELHNLLDNSYDEKLEMLDFPRSELMRGVVSS